MCYIRCLWESGMVVAPCQRWSTTWRFQPADSRRLMKLYRAREQMLGVGEIGKNDDTWWRNHWSISRSCDTSTTCPPATQLIMASLIAILDLKGKPLIQRSYRDDVPSTYIERFLPLILDIEEEGHQVTPCFSSQGINYMHIRHSNLYRALLAQACVLKLIRPRWFLQTSTRPHDTVLALSKRNSNAAEIILFLHRLTQVLVEYFKELEEESIRDNFVIIYELMDEMMDFGYPQTTESKILQESVTSCIEYYTTTWPGDLG